MLRVFLVIDDYNELIYLQTLLKKLGFDVEGLQNQKKYSDVSLGFNPQILITTAHGKKVDGLLLAQSIQKHRGLPKILALKTDNTYSQEDFDGSGVDMVLDSPVSPQKLIYAIATLGAVDENTLLDKYAKIKNRLDTDKKENLELLSFDDNGQPLDQLKNLKSAINEIVNPLTSLDSKDPLAGDASASASADIPAREKYGRLLSHDPFRAERFEKYKKEIGTLPEKNFDREKIREFNKKIRALLPDIDVKEIEENRRLFTEALFKNKL